MTASTCPHGWFPWVCAQCGPLLAIQGGSGATPHEIQDAYAQAQTMHVYSNGMLLAGGAGGNPPMQHPKQFQVGAWYPSVAYDPEPSKGTLKRVKYLPNTLGWRYWHVDSTGCLHSPVRVGRWDQGELRTPEWSDEYSVRNECGIHALLAPELWRYMDFPNNMQVGKSVVFGLVERYGKYVLGEDGWRAEWVVIRELQAPSAEVAEKLRKFYPDIPVHMDEETTNEEHENGYRKGHRDRREGATDVQTGTYNGPPNDGPISSHLTFPGLPRLHAKLTSGGGTKPRLRRWERSVTGLLSFMMKVEAFSLGFLIGAIISRYSA